MAASASSASLFIPSSFGGRNNNDSLTPKSISTLLRLSRSHFPQLNRCCFNHKKSLSLTVSASVSVSNPEVRTGPDDLVASILSKVVQTDGGVLLKEEEHKEVAKMAQELQKYCVNDPVKCPLIFGEWDVVYCSQPTSPGGGYRSAVGRLFFKTKQMIQVVEAPDIIRNKVTFSALGFLNGEVSLKGKLTALDGEWIQVVFEAPELKLGSMEVQYGGQSEVKLRITYLDDKIRLGVGSRGSLFVFQRR